MAQKIWIDNGINIDATWEKHIAYSFDNLTWVTLNKDMLGVDYIIPKKNLLSPIVGGSNPILYSIVLRMVSTQGSFPALSFNLLDVQNQASWTNDISGLQNAISDITGWLGIEASSVIDSSVYSEDTPHVSRDNGVFILSVRNENQITVTSAEQDYSPISVDSRGNLIATSAGKMMRIQGAPDYSRTFTYHGTGTDNVISVVHTGTTSFGSETITETISYVDPAVNGSNVTSIVYS